MTSVLLWIDPDLTSDEEIMTRLTDVNVAVVDLGARPYANRRVAFIRDRLKANGRHDDLFHLHLTVGEDGRVCALDAIDQAHPERYDQFDVLFHQDDLNLASLYDALASVVVKWRGRGRPPGCRSISSSPGRMPHSSLAGAA